MRTPALAVLCCGLLCAAVAVDGVRAQPASRNAVRGPERNLPGIKYDGKHAATLRYGDLSVTIESQRDADTDLSNPVFTGRYRGKVVFSFRIEEAEVREPWPEARLMRLDPAAPLPQVVMTGFTGGAHCCTVTRIATALTLDAWQVIDADKLDGDEGYQFVDLDNDGAKELISYDNSFLYAFASYADSYAPTRIAKLTGTDIRDVTTQPRYRNLLRKKLQEMEADARKNPDLWHSNGFLGGWVAAKSLVGEVDDAWPRMLASYDRDSDWTLEVCTTAEPPGQCHQAFPEALKKHLKDLGYPLPTDDKRKSP
jgi:serine protease Do